MLGKKGQITVFIIIGLIALFAVGIVIVLQRPVEFEAEIPVIEDVPVAVQPLQGFVQSCVEQVAEQALIRAGELGGYTSLDNVPGIDIDPLEPTEGNAVQFSLGSDLAIPYWWYLESPNNCIGTCIFSSKRPGLFKGQGVSIEEQLDEYVNDNLATCLRNFEAFPDFEVELGTPETRTLIARETVSFLVDYPITARRGDAKIQMKDFFAIIDVNLGEIYELATNITNLQAEHSFFEKDAKQLISAFSRLDSRSLPPFYQLDISFSSDTFWIKSQVKEQVQQILASYIPLLQVLSTRNYRYVNAPSDVRDRLLYETLYNRDMILPLQDPHPDLEVHFTYLDWWEPYFDLNCDGELCRAESLGEQFPIIGFLMGVQKYAFAYDISFPVLVEISQPNALQGRGYTFRYFIEANLRNNDPMPAEFNPLSIPPPPQFSSLLFDRNKRTSADITINVRDGRFNRPMEAEIVFSCGDESGVIGRVNGTGTFKFPRCLGGTVGALGGQFTFSAYQPLDTHDDIAKEINLIIQPWRYRNIDIKRVRFTKSGDKWFFHPETVLPHGKDDQTIITISRIKSHPYEDSFESFVEYFGSTGNSEYAKDVAFIPGNYSIKLTTLHFGEVIFPPVERCSGPECFFVPEEPIFFGPEKPFPAGSAEFEWELTKEMLDSGDTVVFTTPVIAIDIVPQRKRVIEDLEMIGIVQDMSDAIADVLTPEVVIG